mgnify:CR=1 FL=1
MESKIEITKDFETQSVQIHFDSKVFKTWDEVLGALEAAKREAEFQLQLRRTQAIQRQHQQMVQEAKVRSLIQV